jgi:hypothetical protein
MGRLQEEKDKTWSAPTNRTIYQWWETSRTKRTSTYKTSEFTHAVPDGKNLRFTTSSPKRDKDYWRIQISGMTRQTSLGNVTSPGKRRELTKSTRLHPTRKDPSRCREKLGEWMKKPRDIGKIPGPKKNVTNKHTQFSIQHVDPQNYEEERIKQV